MSFFLSNLLLFCLCCLEVTTNAFSVTMPLTGMVGIPSTATWTRDTTDPQNIRLVLLNKADNTMTTLLSVVPTTTTGTVPVVFDSASNFIVQALATDTSTVLGMTGVISVSAPSSSSSSTQTPSLTTSNRPGQTSSLNQAFASHNSNTSETKAAPTTSEPATTSSQLEIQADAAGTSSSSTDGSSTSLSTENTVTTSTFTSVSTESRRSSSISVNYFTPTLVFQTTATATPSQLGTAGGQLSTASVVGISLGITIPIVAMTFLIFRIFCRRGRLSDSESPDPSRTNLLRKGRVKKESKIGEKYRKRYRSNDPRRISPFPFLYQALTSSSRNRDEEDSELSSNGHGFDSVAFVGGRRSNSTTGRHSQVEVESSDDHDGTDEFGVTTRAGMLARSSSVLSMVPSRTNVGSEPKLPPTPISEEAFSSEQPALHLDMRAVENSLRLGGLGGRIATPQLPSLATPTRSAAGDDHSLLRSLDWRLRLEDLTSVASTAGSVYYTSPSTEKGEFTGSPLVTSPTSTPTPTGRLPGSSQRNVATAAQQRDSSTFDSSRPSLGSMSSELERLREEVRMLVDMREAGWATDGFLEPLGPEDAPPSYS